MKKILSKLMIVVIGVGIIMSTPARADIRCNQATGKFYCHNAPAGIDQDQYHELCLRVFAIASANPYRNMEFTIIGMLRMVGTPTAIQIIHDLEKLDREVNADVARIHN